jgi:hypothetical protein
MIIWFVILLLSADPVMPQKPVFLKSLDLGRNQEMALLDTPDAEQDHADGLKKSKSRTIAAPKQRLAKKLLA